MASKLQNAWGLLSGGIYSLGHLFSARPSTSSSEVDNDLTKVVSIALPTIESKDSKEPASSLSTKSVIVLTPSPATPLLQPEVTSSPEIIKVSPATTLPTASAGTSSKIESIAKITVAEESPPKSLSTSTSWTTYICETGINAVKKMAPWNWFPRSPTTVSIQLTGNQDDSRTQLSFDEQCAAPPSSNGWLQSCVAFGGTVVGKVSTWTLPSSEQYDGEIARLKKELTDLGLSPEAINAVRKFTSYFLEKLQHTLSSDQAKKPNTVLLAENILSHIHREALVSFLEANFLMILSRVGNEITEKQKKSPYLLVDFLKDRLQDAFNDMTDPSKTQAPKPQQSLSKNVSRAIQDFCFPKRQASLILPGKLSGPIRRPLYWIISKLLDGCFQSVLGNLDNYLQNISPETKKNEKNSYIDSLFPANLRAALEEKTVSLIKDKYTQEKTLLRERANAYPQKAQLENILSSIFFHIFHELSFFKFFINLKIQSYSTKLICYTQIPFAHLLNSFLTATSSAIDQPVAVSRSAAQASIMSVSLQQPVPSYFENLFSLLRTKMQHKKISLNLPLPERVKKLLRSFEWLFIYKCCEYLFPIVIKIKQKQNKEKPITKDRIANKTGALLSKTPEYVERAATAVFGPPG